MKMIKIVSAILDSLGVLLGFWLLFNEVGEIGNVIFEFRTFSLIYVIGGLLLIIACIFQAIAIFSKLNVELFAVGFFSCSVLNCLYNLILYGAWDGQVEVVIIILAIITILFILVFLNRRTVKKADN
ncbi:hypothetical protein [Lactobacillus xylocopicola]|uniref:Uncharacterized protein n=1 Tax=Lactobacillus xylocopicola TaxID=2976676 RepID=A0ABM8BI17_9LACO|nr:hypothetical protein [Lactobacillus xylocopicola]BDR60918.1 hypothetical protein KIM322_11790 [Lactobacillus xylocopicola]